MGVLDIGSGRDSWSLEGLTVDYSRDAIAGVVDALRETEAVESGGLLFGLRTGSRVRIDGFRCLPCEHALGPEFVLSPSDRAGLEKLMQSARSDRELSSLECVGWFRWHRLGEIALSAQDRDLHDRYFRYPGQLAVIFRTGADGDSVARIYAREVGGRIRGCAREFSCPGGVTPSEDEPGPAEIRAVPAMDSGPDVASPWRISWKWLAAGALVLFLLAVAAAWTKDYWSPRRQDALALRAVDFDGQLFIEWDRSAHAVQKGTGATLDIFDGSEKTSVPLDAAQLRQGSVSYSRKSDLVDLRLTIAHSRFDTVQEFLRFIGQPVKPRPGPLEAQAIQQRLDMAQQLEQLRSELRAKDAELRRLQARPCKSE